MINTKEIIFYIIVFLIFYILSKASIYLSTYLNIDLSIIIFALIFTLVLYFSYKYSPLSKDDFHFQVTGQKFCQDPYTYTSDPEKQKYCSQFTPQQIANYTCAPGFYGAPVWYEYTPESDSKWQNKRCDGAFNENNDEPHVL